MGVWGHRQIDQKRDRDNRAVTAGGREWGRWRRVKGGVSGDGRRCDLG